MAPTHLSAYRDSQLPTVKHRCNFIGVWLPTLLLFAPSIAYSKNSQSYAIVDTGQQRCFDNVAETAYPKLSEAFFGQDAHYQGSQRLIVTTVTQRCRT